jgi:hypothetical protein
MAITYLHKNKKERGPIITFETFERNEKLSQL